MQGLQNFKGRCAKVVGCDVDPEVLENPFVDEAVIIAPDGNLPFPDNTFDLIVSNWVFEHIAHPEVMARELLRVTKPGGVICARTPKKYGYVAIAARTISNTRHQNVLTKIQPERKSVDIFPTVYKLNTRRDLERHFGLGGDVVVSRMFSQPAYHFNSKLLYRLFMLAHKLLPSTLGTSLHIFVTKR